MHKFDPKKSKKLDSPWRREQLPPLATLKKIGVNSGMDIADIGCGIGYFSFPSIELIGKKNKVYALDTEMAMLDYMKERIDEENISNIKLVKTEEYDLKINDNSVDFALLVNVLHEIEDKERFLKEAKRVLRYGGKLAVIEWKKEKTDKGPPENHRISIEDIKDFLGNINFKVIDDMEISSYYYGVILGTL